ncbi:hypothetical protein [Dokdonella sp.]|uniref:hypothetical protein n=1 Tax=Dokdonella sp. TaxID=2291710 RepID=UPI003C3389AA
MNLGLLDLPGIVFGPLDRLLAMAHVPGILRVFLWGALAGYAGMWIYRRWSPQQRIAELRVELASVQRKLASYDGEFSGLLPLIRAQFALALRQMRLTAGAALLAAFPILFVLPWLSNQYDREFPPPGTPIQICATPVGSASRLDWRALDQTADANGCWSIAWPDGGESLQLMEGDLVLMQAPTPVPAVIVHKHHWLNWLVGNPAGYLSEAASTDSITIDVPDVDLIPWGPSWLRGWEAAFFLSALVSSLWLRWRWKLN